jgi:CDP-glucose 4,6-dehydratase
MKSILNLQTFFLNKKILITGVTGFKGAWLAQILHLWGAKVVGVSLRPHTKPNLFSILKLNKNIKNYFADIRDFKKIKNIFAKEKPEIVIHLAAQALVRKSYDEPLLTHSTNISGTANILECIRNFKFVKSSVIITTDKVYGSPSTSSGTSYFKEDDSLGVSDPYSSSKAAADIVAQSYIKNGVNAAIARAGNVIGGGDWGEDRLMTDIVRAIYEKKSVCRIRNPKAVRPWQHVFEPLAGYLMLARELYLKNQEAVGVWNFGPHEEAHVSVEYMVKNFIKPESYKIAPDNLKPETAILQLDPTKARTQLDWQPCFTLDKALRLTMDWYEAFYGNKKDMVNFSNKQIANYFDKDSKDAIR